MAEPKDSVSFLRKMVKFVANPATEWSELGAGRQDDSIDLERSELKAMIERKRRNDFVRKREFDTLRKLRRGGLSPEQLAALGGAGRDDSEGGRASEGSLPQVGVKAKIDEIEQQMVGHESMALRRSRRRSAGAEEPTQPLPRPAPDDDEPSTVFDQDRMPSARERLMSDPASSLVTPSAFAGAPLPEVTLLPAADTAWSTFEQPPSPPIGGPAPVGFHPAEATDPREARWAAASAALGPEEEHDAALDEPVIAFANADYAECEASLIEMTRSGGPRHDDPGTWHVLFDFYRAVDRQAPHEALALAYVTRFGRSAPQWSSLTAGTAPAPARPGRELRSEMPTAPMSGNGSLATWIAPAELDAADVGRLAETTLAAPMPWVIDWQPLRHVAPAGALALQQLLRRWSAQALELRWLAGASLLDALARAAPTGVRESDPAYWMARLEVLRLVNRPDQFDEAAMDFCVTYEVSPPPWERSRCHVRASAAGSMSTLPPNSVPTEPNSASFEDSDAHAEEAGLRSAMVELNGQLCGDISAVLARLDRAAGTAPLISVNCARLMRVDFPAAGDLLNWVIARQAERRHVTFTDAHRLVALFFGAMGINAHARVLVPRA